MHTRLFLALACVLLIARLPSLVQPMGADQGLYAYVGERILAGEIPYRDAWDQKPPAIHYTYAALRAVFPYEGAAAAADLLAAITIAALLVGLGTSLAGVAAGRAAALLFLFLSDPGFQRLAGVSVRAQCETFIAVAMTGAFVLLVRGRPATWKTLGAGALLGTAFAFKYNAAAYGAALVVTLWALHRLSVRELVLLAAGCLIVPGTLFTVFAVNGAVRDLYQATVGYNLQYSGETYTGPVHFARYLLVFPVQHARVDALWLLGGAGSAVLLAASVGRARRDGRAFKVQRDRLIAPAWVAAACLTIAINGSRGLPQYFVQALPALALAAAWAGALLWTRRRIVNVLAVAVLAFAVWRVNEFSNLAGNIVHDGRYLLGRSTREAHLDRYGDREERKYSALAMAELADFMRARTTPADHIYIFGFASGAYVQADRESASRFFWSRPVIVDFNAEEPGYGVKGLREDLEATAPAIVALQIRDWAPDVPNSAEFFMSTPRLAEWLLSGYEPVPGPDGFEVWTRRGARP
jgi:hypothetical protein